MSETVQQHTLNVSTPTREGRWCLALRRNLKSMHAGALQFGVSTASTHACMCAVKGIRSFVCPLDMHLHSQTAERGSSPCSLLWLLMDLQFAVFVRTATRRPLTLMQPQDHNNTENIAGPCVHLMLNKMVLAASQPNLLHTFRPSNISLKSIRKNWVQCLHLSGFLLLTLRSPRCQRLCCPQLSL